MRDNKSENGGVVVLDTDYIYNFFPARSFVYGDSIFISRGL
jgi:hypothetical protein